MNIFIQGRKNGNKRLYPITETPKEFEDFAGDIQPLNAPRNANCYGRSFYSIAFNGKGCIFTKCIIGDDTLRGYLGNINISIYIAANQKMAGGDIKILLDKLINIYVEKYCPEFKINDQKQEDWALFQSEADNYDSKVETISADENYQYGSKDAAYHFYDNTTEIEKYLDAPYQEKFKERKQVFFIENQSKIILDVIKHDLDREANLTGNIDWDNTKYTLRIFQSELPDGVSVEIRAKGSIKTNGDKIYKKDNITIKYKKKYCNVNEPIEGKLYELEAKEYLKISDGSIELGKIIDFTPSQKPVKIIINYINGKSITDAVIVCKCKSKKSIPNKEVSQNQNTIYFSGEEQQEKWSISDKRENFKGEEEFTPESKDEIKLTLREVKPTKPQEQPAKGDISIGGNGKKITEEKPFYLYILLGLSVACILAIGVYFSVDMFWRGTCPEVNNSAEASQEETIKSELSPAEIKSYVEGEALFLEELNTYKDEWAKLKNTKDSVEYREYEGFIDKAIKKREAITNGNFDFLTYSHNHVNYSDKQQKFKIAVEKINEKQYEQVKDKLGNVSQLTLTQIADSINKILAPSIKTNSTTEKNNTQPKKEETNQNEKKSNQPPPLTKEEKEIIKYLEGDEFNFQILENYDKTNTSQKLKPSIKLALKFWSLDGLKPNTYFTYFQKVNNDYYLKNNKKLTSFLEDENQKKTDNIYPNSITGLKTLTLSKFIDKTK